MPQYLFAIYLPDDYDPSLEQPRDDCFRCQEVRLRPFPGQQREITDGPYLETKEHIGGFSVLEAADLDEALAWGRKAEVRPILFRPPPEATEG
jgi:hypothetical protein